MELTSTDFSNDELIPAKYTCDGANISPSLKWSGVPKQAKSLALILDDPDAPMGAWTHWILYNLPTTLSKLEEGIVTLPLGTKHGINSWGEEGYGGPCPPSGEHRYVFTLYALDKILDISKAPDSNSLQKIMEEHILDKAVLIGRYRR